MSANKPSPGRRNICREAKSDCIAYRCGICIALQETTFKRPCPFFKSRLRTIKQERKETGRKRQESTGNDTERKETP